MSQIRHERFATGLHAASASSFAAEMLSEADRIIVTARGQLDLNSQPILALILAKAIAAGRSELVVDLEGLDSIDPEDVGLLVRARRLLQSRGQHLVVRSPCTNAEVLAACAQLDPHARVERVDGNEAGRFSSTIPCRSVS